MYFSNVLCKTAHAMIVPQTMGLFPSFSFPFHSNTLSHLFSLLFQIHSISAPNAFYLWHPIYTLPLKAKNQNETLYSKKSSKSKHLLVVVCRMKRPNECISTEVSHIMYFNGKE